MNHMLLYIYSTYIYIYKDFSDAHKCPPPSIRHPTEALVSTTLGHLGIVEKTIGNSMSLGPFCYMDVSENGGTPKSSILIGFSIINHPFWGTPILETPTCFHQSLSLLNATEILARTVQRELGTSCEQLKSLSVYPFNFLETSPSQTSR